MLYFGNFPKMGQGGPLFLNLEGGIPIKRDVVEKNKIAPYCIVCKKKTKNYFWICGSLKIGGGGGWGVTTFWKNSKINIFVVWQIILVKCGKYSKLCCPKYICRRRRWRGILRRKPFWWLYQTNALDLGYSRRFMDTQ